MDKSLLSLSIVLHLPLRPNNQSHNSQAQTQRSANELIKTVIQNSGGKFISCSWYCKIFFSYGCGEEKDHWQREHESKRQALLRSLSYTHDRVRFSFKPWFAVAWLPEKHQKTRGKQNNKSLNRQLQGRLWEAALVYFSPSVVRVSTCPSTETAVEPYARLLL